MAQVYRSEDVEISYDKERGRIKVSGFSFEVELSASKGEMFNVYSGHVGSGRARIRVKDAENVRD